MNFIFCLFYLSFAPKGALAGGGQHIVVPQFIQQKNENDEGKSLSFLQENVNEMSASMNGLANDTKKSLSEMTHTERADLSELLYDHYKQSVWLLGQIPLEKFPQFKNAAEMARDNEESTENAILNINRHLRSFATEEEEKVKNQRRIGGNKNNGFHESNSDDNDKDSRKSHYNYRHRRTERARTDYGHFRKFHNDPRHERMRNLNEAILNGDHTYIHSHILGNNHRGGASSSMQSGGTHRGRRLARMARRLSSKKDKCEVLVQCAEQMSTYDLFVYIHSDDIDPSTGDIDSNVETLFSDKDIAKKKKKIETLVQNVTKSGFSSSSCDDLLSEFHRTVEVGKIPEWEGATISQVCLAEGTTVYVKLASAAAVALPTPKTDFCSGNTHHYRKGNGDGYQLKANDDDPAGVICCSDTKIGDEWDKKEGCDVYAASYIDGTCHKDKTWKEAKSICENVGARLCTSAELGNQCAKDMLHKDKCDLNNEAVKTDTCSDDYFSVEYSGHWTGCGKNGECNHHEHEKSDDNKAIQHDWVRRAVRCCTEEDNKYWFKSCDDGRDVWQNTKLGSGGDDEECWIRFFHEADARCSGWGQGARLCTLEEVNDNCAQSKDCGYDNRMIWTKTPTLPDGAQKLSENVTAETNKTFEELIIPMFVHEVLHCARDLFFSDDREYDVNYRGEPFVFGYDGEDPEKDMDKYQIPSGLKTGDNSGRTIHGQIISNKKTAFTFVPLQQLLDEFHVCRQEAQEEIVDTVNDKLGDQYLIPDSTTISYLEAGIDKYVEVINDKCLANYFSAITKGLELVFGDKPSPGFVCGIQKAVSDGATLPGICCLDAPFNLDEDNWGYNYECSLECKNPGPYFAGISEEACTAQGGTFCPYPSDCSPLKKCVDDYKDKARKTEKVAFENYLNQSPQILNSMDPDQCGSARQYFGYDSFFINDNQICDDIEQLEHSKDFDFLNEFFSQGSDVSAANENEDVSQPKVPPLVLTEVDTTNTKKKAVQDGNDWLISNFALSQALETVSFVLEMIDDAPCPCDPTCTAENVCKGIKTASLTLFEVVVFILQKVMSISDYNMGSFAEMGNVEPIQTYENSVPIYDNMDITGKWLQARFEDLYKYLGTEFDKQILQINEVVKGESYLDRRSLHERLIVSGLSTVDKEPDSCASIDIELEVDESSPRAIVCHFRCKGAAVDPDVLEVRAIDISNKHASVVYGHKSFHIDAGTYLVELPENIGTNVFIIKATIEGSAGQKGLNSEKLISFIS